MKTLWVCVAAMLIGCGDGDDAMPGAQACREQAEAWCAATHGPLPGCEIVYNHWCQGLAKVTVEAQDRCLDAIDAVGRSPRPVLGYAVPAECIAMWR